MVLSFSGWSGLADAQLEAVEDGEDLDLFSGFNGCLGLGLPELAVDEDPSGGGEVGPGGAGLADHALAPGRDPAGMGLEDERQQEKDDARDGDDDRQDIGQAR